MPFYVHICPKCGYTRKFNCEDMTKCEECKTIYVKTNMESLKYFDAWCDDDFFTLNRLNQQLYRKYVYNSPEFDEELFNARQEKEDNYNREVQENQIRQESTKPHCPVCNSTNLSKISTTKKIGKIAMFGIFGMGDNGKTWKCNDCGSKF